VKTITYDDSLYCLVPHSLIDLLYMEHGGDHHESECPYCEALLKLEACPSNVPPLELEHNTDCTDAVKAAGRCTCAESD